MLLKTLSSVFLYDYSYHCLIITKIPGSRFSKVLPIDEQPEIIIDNLYFQLLFNNKVLILFISAVNAFGV